MYFYCEIVQLGTNYNIINTISDAIRFSVFRYYVHNYYEILFLFNLYNIHTCIYILVLIYP